MQADWKKLRAALKLKRAANVEARAKASSQPASVDDVLFFRAAVADVQPLGAHNRIHHDPPLPQPLPRQSLADEKEALRESRFGAITLQDRLEGGDEAVYLRQGVSQQVLKDLRRGRWAIQDEIDLHGCNRDEARQLLADFLHASLKKGVRFVRVIHGKGLRSPGRQGLLRTLVRGWLSQRFEVLAYCQTGPQDGGEGALLVLLHKPSNRYQTR